MNQSKITPLGSAAVLRDCTDSRFKTMRLSVNMLVPMTRQTAAVYGILPGLLTRATKDYPDFASLNRKLSALYGASLSSGVRKMGGFQCLTFSVNGIAGRYAYGGEDMFAELSGLLFSALFDPLKDEAGLFPEEHFLQERRQLLELKDSEFNDKITYAHQRCEELLFQGSDVSCDRYGGREEILALDRAALVPAWDKLLSSARFEIFALGDCEPDPAVLAGHFASLGSSRALEPLVCEEPKSFRRNVEEQPVSQSKLSLGFRVDFAPEEKLLFQLMSAVFGGVPSSKLFRKVREEMGLCYYCSSIFSPLGRSLYVESGVETENIEQAETEIFRQLSLLQAGEITEEELSAAKLSLCNSFRSVDDSLHAQEGWHLSQSFFPCQITPEEAARQVLSYTAGQVAEAAQRVKPAAAFTLKGREMH